MRLTTQILRFSTEEMMTYPVPIQMQRPRSKMVRLQMSAEWGVGGPQSAQFNWLNKHLLRIKESLEPVLKNKGTEVDTETNVSLLSENSQ